MITLKRGAEEYITKEHGTTRNDESAEDKPKMATAAQQARRKIAQPKSRTGRSTTPTAPSSSSFQFGPSTTTQSFPPLSTPQSFNFAVPGASSSFTFGNQNGSSQSSNPFANLNGGKSQDNAMIESNAQQNSSIFSFNTNQPPAATNGFSFGQPSQSQPAGGFGSGGGSGAGGGFGAPKSQEQSVNTGLFGSQPQTNGFTPNFTQSAHSSAPSSPSLFGQVPTSNVPAFGGFGSASTSIADAAPVSAPSFKFGETNVFERNSSTTPQPDESTSTPNPTFAFGQPTTTTAPASAPPKSLFSGFGQPASQSTNSDSAPTPSKSLFSFNQSPASTSPAVPATTLSKPLFNFGTRESTSPTPAAGDNLFARASSADPISTDSQRQKPAEAKTHTEDTQQPQNPFSSLFGTKSQTNEVADTTKMAKPTFKFGETASSLSPMKAPTPPPTSSSDIFTFKPATPTSQVDQTSQPPSSVFQVPPPSSPSAAPSAPNTSHAPTPATNLFNLNKPIPSPESSKSATSSTSSPFSSKPSDSASTAGSTPFKFAQSPTTSTQLSEDAQPTKKRLFSSPAAHDAMAQSALGSLNATSAPSEPVQPKFAPPQKSEPVRESVTRAVSTEGPPSIPRYLSADKYKSYDENWRLKALNRCFKKALDSANPDMHDFMSLVQNYLDHREAIGEGLGQYLRKQVAGTKRKTIDVDDMQPDDEQNKRSRPVGHSSAGQQSSTATVPPKTPAVNMFASVPSPKPATTFSPAKPAGDSATSNLFKSLIPGASSVPTPPFGAAPAKSTTTPPSSPPKPVAPQLPKFEIPKFGSGGGDFASAFAKSAADNAKKFEKAAMEKRKAEEFDSDEDDEEAWNKQYEEEQRAKKSKIEAAARGLLPTFVPSASSSRSNSPFAFASSQPIASIETSHSFSGNSKDAAITIESDNNAESGETSNESGNSGDDEEENDDVEDDLPEDQVDGDVAEAEEEEEEEAEPIPDIPPEESLFSRVEKPGMAANNNQDPILESAKKSYYKPSVMFGSIGKSSPDAPGFSPLTPATGFKGDFTPATTFNFTPTGPSFDSSSVFGGGTLKQGPIPGEGLFGSRPSTPQPGSDSKSSSVFGAARSSTNVESDNTWKRGSPIKFGNDAPTVEVTAATPPTKSFSNTGFFGAATSNGASSGFSFGTPSSSQPAPGFLAATSHFGTTTGTGGTSSRATSPGITSEAESVATDNTEDYSNEPQLSLSATAQGEENEEVLYESRAAVSRLYRQSEVPEKSKITAGWNKVGAGSVKVLKDKDTGKTRIVFRAEPGANVLLNTRLIKGAKYTAQASGKNGTVTFPVAIEENGTSGMQMWMLRVKTKEDAERLSEQMEANKTN